MAAAKKSAQQSRKQGPTAGSRSASAQRSAEARLRIQQAQRRRQFQIVGTVVGVIVVAVGVMVAVFATRDNSPVSGKKSTVAQTTVAEAVANVPSATLDSVGLSKVAGAPSAVSGQLLTQNGKPEILYIGAEYCPYCAAERWPLAVALARFGTFTNLGQTTSSGSDAYPDTNTLTFHGSTYTSKYLSFVPREIYSNQADGDGYAPLDTLTSQELDLFKKYAPQGGFPFMLFGSQYLLNGATYDPQVLQGLTHQQIADDLSDPKSTVGKSIDGSANVITATLCKLTNQQPSSVCSSSGVTAAAAALAKSS